MFYALAVSKPNRNGYFGTQPDDHFEVRGALALGVVVYGWTNLQVGHRPAAPHLVGFALERRQGAEL